MLKLIGIFSVVSILLPYARIFKYGGIQNIILTPDKELNIFVCPMQFMALDRYKITWVRVCVCVCVCLCVCVSAKRFVHDSDHNFCPIFLKFGTWVGNVIVKTPFGGQVPRVNSPPFIPQKPLFGEKILLKPMDSVTAYILTTTKAIITKLDQYIKQIELRANCKT